DLCRGESKVRAQTSVSPGYKRLTALVAGSSSGKELGSVPESAGGEKVGDLHSGSSVEARTESFLCSWERKGLGSQNHVCPSGDGEGPGVRLSACSPETRRAWIFGSCEVGAERPQGAKGKVCSLGHLGVSTGGLQVGDSWTHLPLAGPRGRTRALRYPAHIPAPRLTSRDTPSPVDPDTVEVLMTFEPDPADLALSSIPGHETFDPRRHRFSEEELKPQPIMKKARKIQVPEEQKDEKYWSRRYKNNEAAKRSRDARRLKENQISVRAAFLEKENALLRQEVVAVRQELSHYRAVLSRYQAQHGAL
uniref:D-box binding PAR bZIP transcription factor n=1 Tax=Ursus americanus TaxID=9643 RepID=A0A452R493_URSAM